MNVVDRRESRRRSLGAGARIGHGVLPVLIHTRRIDEPSDHLGHGLAQQGLLVGHGDRVVDDEQEIDLAYRTPIDRKRPQRRPTAAIGATHFLVPIPRSTAFIGRRALISPRAQSLPCGFLLLRPTTAGARRAPRGLVLPPACTRHRHPEADDGQHRHERSGLLIERGLVERGRSSCKQGMDGHEQRLEVMAHRGEPE